MPTRRQVIIGASCLSVAAAAAALTLTHAAPAAAAHQQAHRDLTLRIADGLRRQTWAYVGQTWDERRDTITLHADEVIRLTLINDTRDAVELPPAGPFPGALLRGGEAKSLLLHVTALAPFDLQAISHGTGLTKACERQLRRFEVRAGEEARPSV